MHDLNTTNQVGRIDTDMLLQPVKDALKKALTRYKKKYNVLIVSDSFRIFHGRGGAYKHLEWLCVDYFYPVWVVTCFAPIDAEVEALLIAHLNEHVAQFDTRNRSLAVMLQKRNLPKSPWQVVYGEVPSTVYAHRAGLNYILNFEQQNCGFFLDIEPARAWLEAHAKNKNVLNLFSYTCTFSVVAMANHAASVVNFDLSRRSLDTGRDNHRANNIPTQNVKFFANDILKSWGKIKRHGLYDIIVNDPPSFQKGSFVATKDYKKILTRLHTLLNPNGIALLCLNSPEIALDDFKRSVESTLKEAGADELIQFKTCLLSSDDFVEKQGQSALKVLVYQKTAAP